MKIIKQVRKAFVLFIIFATLVFSATCTFDFAERGGSGRGDLEPLPQGISFEIKFLLCPEQTVCYDGSLRPEVHELIYNALPWETLAPLAWNRDIIMQFIDTRSLELFNAGWINRIRHHVRGGGQPGDVQLTYRRRIPINSGTRLTEEMVLETLMQARQEGSLQWAAQDGLSDNVEIDWSYNSAVLTLSRSVNGIRFDHPDTPPYFSLDGSRDLLIGNFPDGIDDLILPYPRWDTVAWYKDRILNNSFIHGPAFIRRYRARGTISAENSQRYFGVYKTQRVTFDVEVMPFQGGYIVELSSSDVIRLSPAAADWVNFEQVSRLQSFMHDLVRNAGILIPESGLRTSTVLRYMRQPNGSREPEPES